MRPGDLYRFPDGRAWAKHGLLLVKERQDGSLYLEDTYWGGFYCDERRWKPGEIEGRIEFILNLQDARLASEREYDTFRSEHKAWIPVGGGPERFFVLKSAQPDLKLVEEQLRGDVEDAERKLKSATWNLEHAQKKLEEWLARQAASDFVDGSNYYSGTL